MIRTRDRAERWEEAALAAFLLLCLLFSFLRDFFPVLDKGLTAAVFLAIFFVLRQIRDLRLNLEEGAVQEIFFATNEEFYRSAREAVQGAKREIRVTYFRTVPPTKVGSIESREYFDEVLKFARTKGTVRRIIGVSNEAMAEWCTTQAQQARTIPRYNIRVLETTNQAVEPMSVAMIDDDVMYMAFSGPTDQQLGGIREDAPKLVRFHQSRFDQLWERGIDPRDDTLPGATLSREQK
jgi:hypothetical protein